MRPAGKTSKMLFVFLSQSFNPSENSIYFGAIWSNEHYRSQTKLLKIKFSIQAFQ